MRPVVIVTLLGLLCGPLPAVAGDGWSLEKVVVIERHGVRSPTKSPAELARFASDPWPEWPVAPGILTPHGARALERMGAFLKARYAGRELIPATGCPAPDSVFVWADSGDQRTRESGRALLTGMFPGCGLSAHHRVAGTDDPLFDPWAGGYCRVDGEKARQAILARADLDNLGPDYERAHERLRQVLRPGTTGSATADDRRQQIRSSGDEIRLTGPLASDSSIAENLLLEYSEGFPMSKVGWGRLAAGDLADVMVLHNLYADLARKTPYIASHRGAPLAGQILDATGLRRGAATAEKPGNISVQPVQVPVPDGARFILFMGHDTNLSNVSGLLGLDWALEGQPDHTAPGTALVFEIWRNPASGDRGVRALVFSQTLEQTRAAAVLGDANPPASAELRIPGCASDGDGLCRLADFQRIVRDAVPADCLLLH